MAMKEAIAMEEVGDGPGSRVSDPQETPKLLSPSPQVKVAAQVLAGVRLLSGERICLNGHKVSI